MSDKNETSKLDQSVCEDTLVVEESKPNVENEQNSAQNAPSQQKELLASPKPKSRKTSAFAGTIVEVRDKNGILKAAVPFVPVLVAWFMLFFNIFTPGVGTILMSFAALCGARTNSKKPNKCVDFLLNLAAGVLQLLTALLIVGWVWSMFWGMHIVTQSSQYKIQTENKKKPIYNPPSTET